MKYPSNIEPLSAGEKERHNIDKGALDCWCLPTYYKPCELCDGEGVLYHDVACWKCEGGSYRISREEAEAMGSGVIIVHKDV